MSEAESVGFFAPLQKRLVAPAIGVLTWLSILFLLCQQSAAAESHQQTAAELTATSIKLTVQAALTPLPSPTANATKTAAAIEAMIQQRVDDALTAVAPTATSTPSHTPTPQPTATTTPTASPTSAMPDYEATNAAIATAIQVAVEATLAAVTPVGTVSLAPTPTSTVTPTPSRMPTATQRPVSTPTTVGVTVGKTRTLSFIYANPDGTVVLTRLARNSQVTATALSSNSEHAFITTANGESGWVRIDNVTWESDILLLSPAAVVSTPTNTASSTPTPVVQSITGITITLSSLYQNANGSTVLQKIARGETVVATGRSATAAFIHVNTEDGQAGWIRADYVEWNGNITELPTK